MTVFPFFYAGSNMTLQMSVLIGLLAVLQDNALVLVVPDWSECYLMIGCSGETAVEYLGGTECVCVWCSSCLPPHGSRAQNGAESVLDN